MRRATPWRLMERTFCFNPPTGSITGGSVDRGSALSGYQGRYFFADFCTAKIWSFRYDGANLTGLTDRTAELDPGGGLQFNATPPGVPALGLIGQIVLAALVVLGARARRHAS